MEYAGCRNRHQEFVQSIFINFDEEKKKEEEDELAQTLDDLLAKIFDTDGT